MIDPTDPLGTPELFLRIYVIDGAADELSQTDLKSREATSLDTNHPAFGPSSGWDMAFEEFEQLVGDEAGMFFEPDGSWVWTGSEATRRWQLDGQLYDRHGRVIYLELKGWPSVAAWRRLSQWLVGAAREPRQPVVHWVNEGRWSDLGEVERRLLEGIAGEQGGNR
ncbi:MAG: hypothetical protein ACKN81_19495 [Pirellulaceae bacterium]